MAFQFLPHLLHLNLQCHCTSTRQRDATELQKKKKLRLRFSDTVSSQQITQPKALLGCWTVGASWIHSWGAQLPIGMKS